MMDASTSAAGWYPDPVSPGQLRYWDGGTWTEYVHSLTGAATPHEQPRPRKKRRMGLVLGIVGGVAALALGVSAAVVWGIPVISGPALTTQDDWAYAYAPMQEDLEVDHTFTFPADYDFDAMAVANGDKFDTSFAFEAFTDAALTRRVDLTTYQYDGKDEVEVSADTFSTVSFDPSTDVSDTQPEREFNLSPDGAFFWGLQETYYLVQKLDESGVALEKPIVHPFTIERSLPTPQVSYSAAENGSLQMAWDAVPGASEYLVTVSYWNGDDRSMEVVGVTQDTSWSPAVIDPFSGDVGTTEIEQNIGLQTYRLWSAADVESGGGVANALDNDTSEYEYGVVATDGKEFSGMRPTDANEVAAALPKEIPLSARDQQFPNGQRVDSLDQIPTRFYFTSLDGATRQTAAYIDPATITPNNASSIDLELVGRGTALAWPIQIDVTDPAVVAAQIDQYNARVTAEAPTTGIPDVTMVSAPIQFDPSKYTPSATAPAVDYEVWGSNEFTTFLAANLVAHEEAIDVSDFTARPGMPEVDDAIGEAVYQNPYVLGYRGFRIIGGIVYVEYANDAAETSRLQAEIASAVDAAVSSATTDGMSDADKATALNSWLADTAEYDKAALAASEQTLFYPDGFEHAYDPSGVLLAENGNLGVCASYAATYKALLDKAGVESVVVTGDVLDGGGHAWNKVKIDDQWLAVDPTWNDDSDRSRYLLISDSQFTDSAARTEDSTWMNDLLVSKYATP